MSKIKKEIKKALLSLLIGLAVIVGVYILIKGMWLVGLPKQSNIQSVSILYPSVTAESRELSTQEDIEQTLQLNGFLRYDLFATAELAGEALITVTYHLKDGTDQTLSANDTTVWWQGKAHTLKEPELFINLTEGIFFSETLPAE